MRGLFKRYLYTWLALLVLLALSFGSAQLQLGAWNTVANFGIAAVKTALVALVFMRAASSGTLVRIFSLAALFALALLFILSGADFATRKPAPAPWQRAQQIEPWLH